MPEDETPLTEDETPLTEDEYEKLRDELRGEIDEDLLERAQLVTREPDGELPFRRGDRRTPFPRQDPFGEALSTTLIFDEVDSGVGGSEAAALGNKLRRLSDGGQILAVTHLPQVAACADHQINIAKTIKGTTTVTELHELDRDGRIVELARMLSGSPDSDNARAHAAELLQSAAS